MDSVTEASVHSSLGSLHSKVDTLLDAMTDHGKRITSLERKQWLISGGWAVVLLLFGPKVWPLMAALPK